MGVKKIQYYQNDIKPSQTLAISEHGMKDTSILTASEQEVTNKHERSQAAAVQDCYVFGKRVKGVSSSTDVQLKHATLLLGERGHVSPEEIQELSTRLESLGLNASQYKITFVSKKHANDTAKVHYAVELNDLEGKQGGASLTYSQLLDYLEQHQLISHEVRQVSDARASYEYKSFGERISQDGIGGTLKYYWKEAPIRLIGSMYLVGDAIETGTGVINSRESLYPKNAQIMQGVAMSAGSMVMYTHGARKDGLSTTKKIMEEWRESITGSEFGETLGYLQHADDETAVQKVDALMAKHSSELGKGFNFFATFAILQTALQQENPYKLAQFAFSNVGFGLSTFTPQRGVELEDSTWGRLVARTPLRALVEPAFNFLQSNPNFSLLSVLGHNLLGFRSGFMDIQRSNRDEPTEAERAERQQQLQARDQLMQDRRSGAGRFVPGIFQPKPLQDLPYEIRDRFGDSRYHVIDYMHVSDSGHVEVQRSPWYYDEEKSFRSKSPEQVRNLIAISKAGWAVVPPGGGMPRAPSDDELTQLSSLSPDQNHYASDAGHFVRTGTQANAALQVPTIKELNAFEGRVDYYMMLQQLRKTALPWLFSVGWYTMTNAVFAFVKPKQEMIDPEALYSNAAQELLMQLDMAKPEAVQDYTLKTTAIHLSNWLTAHPEIKFAIKKGAINVPDGQDAFEVLFKNITETAQELAAETGQPEKAAAVARHLSGASLLQTFTPEQSAISAAQPSPALDSALSLAVQATQSQSQQVQKQLSQQEISQLGLQAPQPEPSLGK